jgi:hypothetical protein
VTAVKGIFFERFKPRLNQQSVILVEGVDDAHFLDQILTDLNASPTEVGVCISEGKDKFSSLMGAMLKSPFFTTGRIVRYAIIRDVDSSIPKCMGELTSLFSEFGEPMPPPNNTVARTDGRNVGLFLMPSHDATGSLETLALDTVGEHELLVQADLYISLAAKNFGGASDHIDKRRAQAFLASRSDPLCNGVGWASRQGVFDIQSPVLQPMKDFLKIFLAI